MKIMIAAGRRTTFCEHGSQSSCAPGHGWRARGSSIVGIEAMDGRAFNGEVSR